VRRSSASSPAARVAAIVLIVIGVVVVVSSFFADDLNLTRGGDGLGWLQLIGVIVGLVVLLIGLAWLLQPKTRRDIE
jgi:uncharacterized membrane protein